MACEYSRNLLTSSPSQIRVLNSDFEVFIVGSVHPKTIWLPFLSVNKPVPLLITEVKQI